MVYSPGNREYHAAYTAPSGRSEDESRLPRHLFIVVAVLGLMTYGLSFGPVVDGGGAAGWYVRFAALAALTAAVGLMPNTRQHPSATAILAATGFLDALSSQLLSPNPGWALTMIAVLNAAQAAVAIAVLVVSRNGEEGYPGVAGYEAYAAYYNQAVREYYSQHAASAEPGSSPHHGDGQASSAAQVTDAAPSTQQAPQHAEYSDFVSGHDDYSRAASAAEPSQTVPQGGLPRFRPAKPSAGRQEARTEQSALPP